MKQQKGNSIKCKISRKGTEIETEKETKKKKSRKLNNKSQQIFCSRKNKKKSNQSERTSKSGYPAFTLEITVKSATVAWTVRNRYRTEDINIVNDCRL